MILETCSGLAVTLAAVWVGWSRRLRRRTVERCRLACPRSGADVDCLLVRDARTGRWISVNRCSARPNGPLCEQQCVEILNMGIPLPPRGDGAARSDEASARKELDRARVQAPDRERA